MVVGSRLLWPSGPIGRRETADTSLWRVGGAGGFCGVIRIVIALARQRVSRYRVTVVPWALDVRTLEWSKLDPPRPWPEGQAAGSWAKLWYDADHNVHVFVNDVKRDRHETYDGGVTETWAFRYKREKTR